MKLNYYHYYFKERRRQNAPRVCHDIRPLLETYINYDNHIWKTTIEGEDGEKLLLLRTQTRGVYMLVATRHQEIIKAIHTETLTCEDLRTRLRSGETAGFAGYFSANERALGLAATLRGPKTAALTRFINHIIQRIGVGEWRFEIQSVGSSVTMQEAQVMAFVARTTIQVSAGNPLFRRLQELFSRDSDDVSSFEIIIRNKKNRNLRNVFQNMTRDLTGEGIDKMRIRAKAAADETLSDYFVEEDGKLSEEIGTGSERYITNTLANHFTQHPNLAELITNMMEDALYEDRDVPKLACLGDINYWHNFLRTE